MVLAVAGAISKNHYAQSVLFHKGGTVATDGHIAVSVTPPSDDIKDAPLIEGKEPTLDYGEFCVDVDAVKKIKKGLSHKETGSFPILRNAFVIGSNGDRKLVATDLSATVAVPVSEDGGPPKSARDMDQLTPEGDPAIEITFNAELMIRLLTIFKEAEGDRYNYPVTFKIWNDTKAVRVDGENMGTGQKIAGLIMPFKP